MLSQDHRVDDAQQRLLSISVSASDRPLVRFFSDRQIQQLNDDGRRSSSRHQIVQVTTTTRELLLESLVATLLCHLRRDSIWATSTFFWSSTLHSSVPSSTDVVSKYEHLHKIRD